MDKDNLVCEKNKFTKLFPIKKPIIGMIHLAGKNNEKVGIALEELLIYDECGVDGAIIEDYHGEIDEVYETLKKTEDLNLKMQIGVNILTNPYFSFKLASEFGGSFVQFDSVLDNSLDLFGYIKQREKYPHIIALGGVRFKYTKSTKRSLIEDIEEGKERTDAIVTTGEGTGIETPIEKLREFKNYLPNFPLIVGAGVNLESVSSQLEIADGAIIGSYFKMNGNTQMKVERKKVKALMDVVREIRENKNI